MNSVSDIITSAFGILLLAAVAYELKQRRKRLRELYNVLDAEDKQVVADLDEMVKHGLITPYTPH
ncbi:MAG: hypothetical protein EBT06_00665 [Gammaproteobacteria bacterium]|jgi:hypothetical protein|nr:hypothetical protein [Gammaproteobacteria bacterium]NBY22161.1 hypothetical protein [Gammaproteobacteria bacterium]NDE33589.1 hypothetical protein [Gammaproteobacteria bacterium]NDE57282.1 hypothetical protein [Gammaproteobacteria bacterium]